MKVWIFNHYATTMFMDHGGRHYEFAKHLREKGFDVQIFCASTLHNSGKNLITDNRRYYVENCDGIPFVVIRTPNYTGNGIKRVINMVSYYFGLLSITRKFDKPDVIIGSSVHPLACVAALKLSKKYKCKNIIEIRDLWPESIFAFGKARSKSLIGSILVAGEHWIYQKAHALIFTKEGDTDYLKEKKWTTEQGGDVDLKKCHYINNGVNLKVYNERILTECLDDPDLHDASKFNVIYAGAVRPVNNVGNILDCAKILQAKSRYNDVQFLIYGEGSELEQLKQRALNELLDNVKLKGFVQKKYIPYLLSKSSVNILNYAQNQYNWTRGNSSNKLFEYMASGKPIISTVRMGYSIINNYCCGIELSKCTPEALANAIIRFHDMSTEEWQQYGQNAAEGAKDFDINTLIGKFMSVIESVMA